MGFSQATSKRVDSQEGRGLVASELWAFRNVEVGDFTGLQEAAHPV